MLRTITNRRVPLITPRCLTTIRWSFGESKSKRSMQTTRMPNTSKPDFSSGLNYSIDSGSVSGQTHANRWAKHSLSFPTIAETNSKRSTSQETINIEAMQPKRRNRADRFKRRTFTNEENNHNDQNEVSIEMPLKATGDIVNAGKNTKEAATEIPKAVTQEHSTSPEDREVNKPKKKRRALKPRKALISLTPSAVSHLRALMDQPEPKLIRIGVRNRGCSGLTYHLEYVDEAGKFDELIEQDGVKVLIDSKALFSIVGSQMDWLDDKLSSRFIFKNPNSKGTCGCGESFMV